MNMSRLIASAIAASVALPALAASPGPVAPPSYGNAEKCYAIAMRGANDCKTATHSCAGTSTKMGDPAAWLYVPAGTCEKIVGGSLTAKS